MPMYEYQCPICGQYYEEFASLEDYNKPITCECGEEAVRIIGSAPAIDTSNLEGNFTPYYDGQLDQHFQSKSQKDKWLKDNGYTQVSGPSCPQEDKPGNFRCTESQAKKL